MGKPDQNRRTKRVLLCSVVLFGTWLLLSACSPAPQITANVAPDRLQFDGERAFALEQEIVERFPVRHSGTPNSRFGPAWMRASLESTGLGCYMDEWTEINYSRPFPLRNLVCRLEGESELEIILTAHHDQGPTTVEGADNDASGVAIVMHLAEIFAAEEPLPHSLVFVIADAEEFGNLGINRFIKSHPNPEKIIAAISLDNLGRPYYDALDIELTGQFRRYGRLWLALTAREAANAIPGLWPVNMEPLVDQIVDQAAPANLMDQGPFVAAGVPSLGFTGHVPPACSDLQFALWHDPRDAILLDASLLPENDCISQKSGPVLLQTAGALAQSGQISEALVRQLMAMESFPREAGPYLYFEDSGAILRGWPLYLIFIGFLSLFFLGAIALGGVHWKEKLEGWRRALPHFLGLWLPLVAGIFLLYLLEASGFMLEFARYPAATKDPYLANPRWPAVVLFLGGLSIFFYAGRRIAGRYAAPAQPPVFSQTKSLAFLAIGLAGLYPLLANPFSLFFMLPLVLWFFIAGRRGIGRLVDILLFLMGGAVLYLMIYQVGFGVLRTNFKFLWYMMNMVNSGMIGFGTALASATIIAAGLSMIVNPVKRRYDREETRQIPETQMQQIGNQG